MSQIKKRVKALESKFAPPNIKFKEIPPDATLQVAMRIYFDNLKTMRNFPLPDTRLWPEMNLAEATKIYETNFKS